MEVDLDTSGAFDLTAWLNSDEVGDLQRHLEHRIIHLLFSEDPDRNMAMQLAWIGAEPHNKLLLAKEIVQLKLSSENEVIQCGWDGPQKLWNGTCKMVSKTVDFVVDHSTEILTGVALCATGIGSAYVLGYSVSVAIGGVVVVGAGAILASEDKPNPHIPQYSYYPSKSELEILQQSPSSALSNLAFPKSPDEFLVTSKGIWANGQFYSTEPLITPPNPIHPPHSSIAQSAPFLTIDSQPALGTSFDIYQMRGGNALACGLYQQALEDLNQAIVENPTHPTSYLHRGAAHFGLGDYEKSVQDFQQFASQVSPVTYPLSISEFSLGFAKGLPKGVFESGHGILLFLSDFITHPIHTSGQVVHSISTLVDLVRKDEWNVIAEALSPEIHQLVTEWDTLSSEKRGELAGIAIGKYGADILLPGAITKIACKSVQRAQELAAICKNLQIAQETLLLETAAGIGCSAKIAEVVEVSRKTTTLADELGFTAKEMGTFKQAGVLEETLAKGADRFAHNPTLRESFELHQKAQEFLVPYVKQFMSENRCKKLIHQAGMPTFPRPTGIPDNFRVQISEKGAGLTYMHPDHTHTSVRIMPGKPHSPFPYQKKPYVIHTKDGQCLDKFGNRITGGNPSKTSQAHIPLEEFLYRD